mmetsp:Transcript_23298/g.66789  ORF Transcript_23298/g.66789 Transcript_23298/m.66789 type:complete len:493 (+) Transcript_23298:320-1798(+)
MPTAIASDGASKMTKRGVSSSGTTTVCRQRMWRWLGGGAVAVVLTVVVVFLAVWQTRKSWESGDQDGRVDEGDAVRGESLVGSDTLLPQVLEEFVVETQCDSLFDCCDFFPSDNITESAEACIALFNALQKVLDKQVRRNRGKGGGVARVESTDKGILWQSTSGRLYGGADAPDMTLDTLFEIASITKTVTAAVVLKLVEAGRISLRDEVVDLLPDGAVPEGLLTVNGTDGTVNLTVWHLLSHRGGLPDFWDNWNFLEEYDADPNYDWTPQETIAWAAAMDKEFPPQTSIKGNFAYGDTNYVILGLLVEHLTGKALHKVFREAIFDPLDMNSTYMSYKEEPRTDAPLSHRYGYDSEDLHNVTRQAADWASGGLISDVHDTSIFIRGFMEGRIIRPDTLAQALDAWQAFGSFSNASWVHYGLGTMKLQMDWIGLDVYGHVGYGNSYAFYSQKRKLAVVGTVNNEGRGLWTRSVVPILEAVEAFLQRQSPASES